MTISECRYKLERLRNDLEYYKEKRRLAFEKTQPKSSNLSSERVKGGKTPDKLIDYLESVEYYDDKIKKISKELNIFSKWLSRTEKIILSHYKDKQREVIQLREENNLEWDKISQRTYYSLSQAYKIYSDFLKEKTNIER